MTSPARIVGTPSELLRISGEMVGAQLEKCAYAIPRVRQRPEALMACGAAAADPSQECLRDEVLQAGNLDLINEWNRSTTRQERNREVADHQR